MEVKTWILNNFIGQLNNNSGYYLKGDKMIDKEFVLRAQKSLLREKKITENQLEKYQSQPRTEEKGELGADLNARAVNRQNHQSLIEKLQDIDAALVRIEKGTYGICVDCEEEIPIERLEYAYYVKRDKICQKKMEKSQPSKRRYW